MFKHALCSTRLDESGACPKCELVPLPEDIITEPRRGRGRLRDDPVAIALREPHRLLEPVRTP